MLFQFKNARKFHPTHFHNDAALTLFLVVPLSRQIMVKPPKTMQPEGIDKSPDVKNPHKGMREDTFHHYMARKISLQRQQFGIESHLPPPPRKVRFQEESPPQQEPQGMSSLLERLKRKHGKKGKKRKRTSSEQLTTTPVESIMTPPKKRDSSCAAPPKRADLFLRGICIMVNGHTNPDNDTLRRMLHKYGGDLETYETTRITHIIATHLSFAKAKIYKKQRNPIPVVKPDWIVDCVQQQRLLPHGPYLLDEVKDKGSTSVKTFFQGSPKQKGTTTESPPPPMFACSTEEEYGGDDELTQLDSPAGKTALLLHTQLHDRVESPLTDSFPENFLLATSKNPSDVTLYQDQHEEPVMDLFEKQPMSASKDPNEPVLADSFQDAHNVLLEHQSGVASYQAEQVKQSELFEQPVAESDDPKMMQAHRESSVLLTGKTDSKYIHGKLRSTGTDPDFLESFFHNSRLSFIGSYKQRARTSPLRKAANNKALLDSAHHRFVLHVDMDCFFAAVVLRNFPQHRNKPVAISHHGNKDGSSTKVSKTSSSECATCNYEARTYGIKKGMYLGRARELCPSLIVLQYDFEGYEQVSEQVVDILYRYAAEYEGAVEQVSCDEAYMELQLVKGHVDEKVYEDVKEIAERIRQEIFSTTECTATIGIGANKLLAKLGTDKAKPDGCHVVEDFRDLLEPLNLRELHGIGRRSEHRLTSEGLLTVKDVWDLGDHAESELCRILGAATGKKILAFCHGEDDREVKPAARKTIGAECNYGVRFDGPYGVDYLINGLAQEVEKRMHGVGVMGGKLTLKVKQRKAGAKPAGKFLGHGSCHNLSRSLDLPGGVPSNASHVFAKFGMQLFQELGVPLDDVRGMGLTVSKLSSGKSRGTDSTTSRMATWLQPKLHSMTASEGNDNLAYAKNEEANVVHMQRVDETDNIIEPQLEATPDEPPLATPTASDRDHDEIDDDFELPPPSQIRMSQVEALPSPLRRKITAMLESSREVIVIDEIDDAPDDENLADPQWKQTSVRSLFKLAAVKAGKENLAGSLGESVSLTQLECLPLEMQLQIADGGQIGSPTRITRHHVAQSPAARPTALFREPSLDRTTGAASFEPELVHVDDEELDEPEPPESPSVITESRRSFYLDNVAPLKTFLNENDPNDEESLQRVIDFLTTCSQEGRLQHVVNLLRSIKNRSDGWSGTAYEQIINKVDESIREQTGCYLDRSWLKL